MNDTTNKFEGDKHFEKLLKGNENAAANIAKMNVILRKHKGGAEGISSVDKVINDCAYGDTVSLDRTLKLFELKKSYFNVPPDIKTFLYISGNARDEKTANNILRFLLDPDEPHGFGNILTRALYDLYRKKSSKNKIKDLNNSIDKFTVIQKVYSEYKRIDIVVEAETHVIGIEMKVRADINNPLSEYRKRIEDLAGERECLYFLLTLSDNQEEIEGFIPITYRELFTEATKYFNELSVHNIDKHFIYLHLFYDLFNTMDNHVKNKPIEDNFEKFLQEDKERPEQILFLMKKLIGYEKIIIDKVRSILDDFYKKENIRRNIWTKDALYTLYHDISIPEIGHLGIDAFLNRSSGKWQINLKGRGTSTIKKWVNKLSMKNEPGYRKIIENEEKGEHFDINKIKDYADKQRVFSDPYDVSGNNIYIVKDVIGNEEEDIKLLTDLLKGIIGKLDPDH